MTSVVVIGGCGHIGSWLVPKLVHVGFDVTSISRGKRKPYTNDSAWRYVHPLTLDRASGNPGDFESAIASLDADIVVDLINFSLDDTTRMVDALRGTRLSHYLFCSSIWAHGRATVLPATEDQPKLPLDEYGIEKAKSEAYLHDLYRREGFPETVVMPGQISGPGWNIINPQGNEDKQVFASIRRGEAITLPNFGMETLHHVHADDVAQVFFNAITHRNAALGESFHAVGDQSITLLGYAQAMYRHFGHDADGLITLLPWDEWRRRVDNEAHVEKTYFHIARSGMYSIEKGRRLLDYRPRHTWLETVTRSVDYMVAHGWLD